MRPIYETENDRSSEAQVAEILAGKKFGAVAMPLRYPVDYALVDGDEVVGFYEIKCRNNERARYPTYMISLQKIHSMLDLQERSGVPVSLAVQWTDCLGVLRLPRKHTVGIGGRSDRGDAQDREPVALFPVSYFRIYRPKGCS